MENLPDSKNPAYRVGYAARMPSRGFMRVPSLHRPVTRSGLKKSLGLLCDCPCFAGYK